MQTLKYNPANGMWVLEKFHLSTEQHEHLINDPFYFKINEEFIQSKHDTKLVKYVFLDGLYVYHSGIPGSGNMEGSIIVILSRQGNSLTLSIELTGSPCGEKIERHYAAAFNENISVMEFE